MIVKLKKEQKIKITQAKDIYPIMREILLRENEYGIIKEHFWTIGLDPDNTILYIELVSLGSMTLTVINPKEVFRFAVQKSVTSILLCHNHPFGSLEPSDNDIEVTDKLNQGSKQLDIEILDHLIINPETFYSFVVDGIFEVIQNSDRFITRDMKEKKFQEKFIYEGEKKGRKDEKIEIAKKMLLKGVDIKDIANFTGLSKVKIKELSIS